MSLRKLVITHIKKAQEKQQNISMEQAKLTVFKPPTNVVKISKPKQEDDCEHEIVEREIFPEKIICPDCGGTTWEGLDYCNKCGGELTGNIL